MDGVAPLSAGQDRIVGEAYTLRFIPMREDLAAPEVLARPDYAPRAVIEKIPEGAILAVDCMGVTKCGSIGDILASRLRKRGIAGVVTDGSVRDRAGVTASGMPTWCAGVAAPPTIADICGGDMDCPIGCGGVAVIPGDILVCDDDGVVVIPRAMAEEVASGAVEQERFEAWVLERVEEGRSSIGLYPPNEETRAEYEAWKAENVPA